MAVNEKEKTADEKPEDVSKIEDVKKEEVKTENKPEEKKKNKKEPELSESDKLKKELDDQKDKYIRLMAEYDNFRKRTAKEKSEIYSDATIKAVGDILPIYDNFERALASESADENFKKGIEMIFNLFTETLKKLNVEIINPVGEEFDPNIAQAVNQVQDENFGDNTVSQVFQKGYKLGDKIIRHAMVVVANP